MANEVPKDSLSSFEKIPKKSKFATLISSTNSIDDSFSSESDSKAHELLTPLLKKASKTKVQESRVMRFLNKVNHFFGEILSKAGAGAASDAALNTKAEPKHLIGRIHQFQKEVEIATKHLNALRKEIEEDGDLKFLFLVSSVLDPLLKEVCRLEKAREQQMTAAQHVRESKEYVDWIEKAKKWIDLCANRHTHAEDIHQAYIDHTFCEFCARIDKDLQVIQDYLNLYMNKLEGNDLVKIELKDHLDQELSQHIFELYLLKDHHPGNSIETLNEWRAKADLARESYFSEALHMIDKNIGELMQPMIIEDNIDQSIIDIQLRLTNLDEQLVKLDLEITELKDGRTDEKVKMCLTNLAKMEDEAHSLNGNLKLNHEHVLKVQEAINALSALRERLI